MSIFDNISKAAKKGAKKAEPVLKDVSKGIKKSAKKVKPAIKDLSDDISKGVKKGADKAGDALKTLELKQQIANVEGKIRDVEAKMGKLLVKLPKEKRPAVEGLGSLFGEVDKLQGEIEKKKKQIEKLKKD